MTCSPSSVNLAPATMSVSVEDACLALLADLAQVDLLVPRGGHQGLAVGGVGDRGDRAGVADEGQDGLLRHAFPEAHEALHRAGQPIFAVRRTGATREWLVTDR